MQNSRALWAACQNYFKANIEEGEYEKWFSNVEFESFAPATNLLTLQVPSDYISQYIEKNYIDHLRIAISNTFGRIRLSWHITVVNKPAKEETTDSKAKRTPKGYGLRVEGAVDTESPDGIAKAAVSRNDNKLMVAPGSAPTTHLPEIDSQLNFRQTFSNYVEGRSNKLCRSVGLSIAEHPQGTKFNPFFVFGPSGCGKTHLVNAIGVRCKEMYPQKRVLYVSARTFQVQFVNAQLKGKINDFIAFYQTVDMLIVDDVQEWTSSPKTQETFFHIFNHLFMNGKRIILASDRPPVDLQGMSDRLLTRFSCGLIAELEKPNVELCMDILQNKIKRDGLHIPDTVVRFIAETANGSVRDLEGVINSLMAYSVVYNCNIDMRLAERVIKRAVKIDDNPLTIDDILDSVCTHFSVTVASVNGRSRKREFVEARQVSMYLAQKYTKMPASRIGKLLGGRDHSTVIHSCTKVHQLINTDKLFSDEIASIENSLKLKR